MIINSKDNKITQSELAAMGVTHSGYQSYQSTCMLCAITMVGIILLAIGGVS